MSNSKIQNFKICLKNKLIHILKYLSGLLFTLYYWKKFLAFQGFQACVVNVFPYNFGCIWSRCSNSSADRSRKAADSRYPVTSCRTAEVSVGFNLWLSRDGDFCFIRAEFSIESVIMGGVEQPEMNRNEMSFKRRLPKKVFFETIFFYHSKINHFD